MARFAPSPSLVLTAKEALAHAPGWARVELTFGNDRLRDAALTELAVTIAERLENPPPDHSPDQLPLL